MTEESKNTAQLFLSDALTQAASGKAAEKLSADIRKQISDSSYIGQWRRELWKSIDTFCKEFRIVEEAWNCQQMEK